MVAGGDTNHSELRGSLVEHGKSDAGTLRCVVYFACSDVPIVSIKLPGAAYRCRFGAVQEPNPVRRTTDLARAGLLMTLGVVKESSCLLRN